VIHIIPKERKGKPEGIGVLPLPVIALVMVEIKEKRKNPYNATVAIGTITVIMLAVRPNFLPVSRDTTKPQMLFYGDLGISFAQTSNLISQALTFG
jgi:hypothetical protein